jgi:hypothetical protein
VSEGTPKKAPPTIPGDADEDRLDPWWQSPDDAPPPRDPDVWTQDFDEAPELPDPWCQDPDDAPPARDTEVWTQDPDDAPEPRDPWWQDPDDAPPPPPDTWEPHRPTPDVAALKTKSHEQKVLERLAVFRVDRDAKRLLDAEERPPFVLPSLCTLRERLARERIDNRWRIEGWLPVDARVTLVAQFKAGKTTLVGNLLRSLLDGDPWLGSAAVLPIDGFAVLIDTEMAESQLDDWYRDQRIVHDNQVVPLALRGKLTSFNLLDATVRSAWADHLRTLGTKYLILDCLRPVMDALGLDEQHDAGRLLVAFDLLLAEAGIREAAVVHHMGHGAERARGDSRLRDWPDVEWQLFRRSDDPSSARYIRAFGRDVNVPESAVAFNDAFRHLTLTGGGSRRETAVEDALSALLSVLEGASQPMSGRSLQAALEHGDHPREAIRGALKHGIHTGAILVAKGARNSCLHSVPMRTTGSVSTDAATSDTQKATAPVRRSAR